MEGYSHPRPPPTQAHYPNVNQVVNGGVPYYIGPVEWAKGGGVKLINKKCPLNAIQDPKEVTKGDSFLFVLNAYNQTFLRLSYPLGVQLSKKSANQNGKCKGMTYLKIDDAEAKPPSNFVTSDGLFERAVSCFQFVEYPKPTSAKVKSYLLQLCPTFCGAGPDGCFNVSTYVDNGTKYLASRGTPLEIVFKKASA
ncbi:miraculin [Artemisia annua]|uniref:Miraculin n=1 Tax=Artemisia annua TaxID=35608 RepID=A0A2U1P6Q4_ARTAN|nr:miraculin [Artemisia annua]